MHEHNALVIYPKVLSGQGAQIVQGLVIGKAVVEMTDEHEQTSVITNRPFAQPRKPKQDARDNGQPFPWCGGLCDHGQSPDRGQHEGVAIDVPGVATGHEHKHVLVARNAVAQAAASVHLVQNRVRLKSDVAISSPARAEWMRCMDRFVSCPLLPSSMAPAVCHVGNGGLARRGFPCRVGRNQCPVSIISLAVMRLRASMMPTPSTARWVNAEAYSRIARPIMLPSTGMIRMRSEIISSLCVPRAGAWRHRTGADFRRRPSARRQATNGGGHSEASDLHPDSRRCPCV